MRLRLNDPLVTSIDYKGKEYDIDLAFDNVLDVFDVLKIPHLHPYAKAKKCLEYLLDEETYEEQQVIDLWNYIFENFIIFERKKPIEYDLKGNPMPVHEDDEEEQHIDIAQDAELIYASFLQAYNIDLYQHQGKMHWHLFKSLLNGLPSNTILQRIVQIRAWKPSKHDSAEDKKNMEKLQSIYALEDNEPE